MLKTEMRNPKTTHIDKMTSLEMLRIMSEENFNAVRAVDAQLENIAAACDAAARSVNAGGRIFYIGCGTSGRLGVLDASECPPTYGVSRDSVVGIIAGGNDSLVRASEGSEDNAENGRADFAAYSPTSDDILIGISAAGGAKYVLGAIEYAKSIGCTTVGVTSNESPLSEVADIAIVTDTGAEVVTGSTRMKAGTAQKLVLNMISTSAMIMSGKVYENLMINLKPSNIKLRGRMLRITSDILGCTENEAEALLERADWSIRGAIELYGNIFGVAECPVDELVPRNSFETKRSR